MGLAAAHAQGVVHRDLKPENVILDDGPQGRVALVSDFGVTRLVDAATRTRQSRTMGTVDYVAPEVLSGEPATAASDVYALGVLLFELLLGWRPFRGASPAAVMAQHLHADLVEPPQVPADLWQVMRGCLARDPAHRPEPADLAQRLTVLAHELHGVPAIAPAEPPPPLPVRQGPVRTEVGGVRRPGAVPPAAEHGRRLRRLVLSGVAVACALLAFGGLAFAVAGPSRDTVSYGPSEPGIPRAGRNSEDSSVPTAAAATRE